MSITHVYIAHAVRLRARANRGREAKYLLLENARSESGKLL
jgi:hypothetical protein